MVVLDYEINLSKTEYLYYLECPQKFRLHRLLNPIPYKSTFMGTKRSNSSYFLRNYLDENLDGIVQHSFFETFHQKYRNKITDSKPPKDIVSNPIKSLYWDYQQKKYFEKAEHWTPMHTELRLMTKRQRGVIDCVEVCVDKEGLRIIDYKPKPHPSDRQALIFYTNLWNEFRAENMEHDNLLYDVMEIGCYYYQIGIEKIFELETDDMLFFNNRFQQIITEISLKSFPLIRDSCGNCDLGMVCRIEEGRK